MKHKKNEIFFVGFFMAILSLMDLGNARAAWSPIIGIPEPPFGINEIAPATPIPWNSDTSGFYYVCQSCPGTTNSGRTYGNPTAPRASIPSTLPAGSIVELHGTYTAVMDPFQINGTVGNPVFIRGVDSNNIPLIKAPWYPKGSYYIIENVHFTDSGDNATAGKIYMVSPSDHVVLRNSEVDGNANAGGLGVLSWDTNAISYAVINNNKIHNNGDVNASYDQDIHGVAVGARAQYVWITNNELYANSGDGIQINAGSLSNMATTHHIYVGKNTSHGNKQAGMWTKQAVNVIFSQNTIYNHRASNSSPNGPCTGFQYGPENVWFLYNNISDCDTGIGMFSTSGLGNGVNTYVVGNVIHNIHPTSAWDAANTYSNAAITTWGGVNRYIINNTIYDYSGGIYVTNPDSPIKFENNIMANRTDQNGRDIFLSASVAVNSGTTLFNNNIYTSSQRIQWGSNTIYTLPSFQSTFPTKGTGSINTNPNFVSPTNNNFRLMSNSPAKDAGLLSSVYNTFQNLYGMSIAVDSDRNPRPLGNNWDIGAYEIYSDNKVPVPPFRLDIK